MFNLIRDLFGPKRGRPVSPSRSVRLLVEILEARVVLDTNYWMGPAPQGGQAAGWDVDANWSLARRPIASDDVVFDAAHSLNPCLLPATLTTTVNSLTLAASWTNIPAPPPGGANAANDQGGAGGGGSTQNANLTVSGTLQTVNMTVNARQVNAGQDPGDEVIIGGQITLNACGGNSAGVLSLQGGRITGSGTLLLDQGAVLTVNGTSSADRPTLGCTVQIANPSGGGRASINFGGIAGQPLMVKGNANINVNSGGTFNIDIVPPQGVTNVTAIGSFDAGSPQVININGGTVQADGNYSRVVGMGVQLNSGGVLQTAIGNNRPLEFTGSAGLGMAGGTLTANSKVIFDTGAGITGGTLTVPTNSGLTLGLAAAPVGSTMYGASFTFGGTLTAYGGFSLYGGALTTGGSTSSAVQMNPGDQFLVDGGTLTISVLQGQSAVGTLTVNGDLVAYGGIIRLFRE